ncbi:MAG: RNA-binding protein [Desulforhopalus sp.]|jgi:spoIIIJ-associated protein|nr:RNA-binding protein [Desulforhopalus sp.]
MSLEKKDFYGKEVTAAIKNACDTLGVAQEKLEIEIIETGSTGIFGLIRKKAHIRVLIKPEVEEISADVFEVDSYIKSEPEEILKPDSTTPETVESEPEKAEPFSAVEEKVVEPVQKVVDVNQDQNVKKEKEPEVEVSLESVEIVKTELLQLVELMGFPSTLEVETAGLSVACTLRGDFEENLTGTDGKVLDSLQYILRKVISRKVPERLRISINIGDFRERRLEELKVRAVELATQVKEDGKTQVLPALNPSERRVIHMILQEDKEIRSRSVGDGLFKKILIYKPGKGNRPGGRKRSQSRGRQNKSSSKKGSES